MSLAVKDAKMHPYKIRRGSRLKRAIFNYGRLWSEILEGDLGEVLIPLSILGLVGVPIGDAIAVWAHGVSAWLFIDLPIFYGLVGSTVGSLIVSEEGDMRTGSDLLCSINHSLGARLASSIDTLNKTLGDSGLDKQGRGALAYKVQTSVKDIGVLAQSVLESQKSKGFDSSDAIEQLKTAVEGIEVIAQGVKDLSVEHLRVEKERQARLRVAKAEARGSQASIEISEVQARIAGGNSELLKLGEHIVEVAKAQKELTSGLGE